MSSEIQTLIQDTKSLFKTLKTKERSLEIALSEIANKKSHIHQSYEMPIFGEEDDFVFEEYKHIPPFIPGKRESDLNHTWNILIKTGNKKLSEKGFKIALSSLLLGESAEYFYLYEGKSLKEIIDILANRFGKQKSSDQYIKEIDSFQRQKGQNLAKCLETLKFLIHTGYKHKKPEVISNLVEENIRNKLPKLVSKAVLKKLIEEERKSDLTGHPFDLERKALELDDLEKRMAHSFESKRNQDVSLSELNCQEQDKHTIGKDHEGKKTIDYFYHQDNQGRIEELESEITDSNSNHDNTSELEYTYSASNCSDREEFHPDDTGRKELHQLNNSEITENHQYYEEYEGRVIHENEFDRQGNEDNSTNYDRSYSPCTTDDENQPNDYPQTNQSHSNLGYKDRRQFYNGKQFKELYHYNTTPYRDNFHQDRRHNHGGRKTRRNYYGDHASPSENEVEDYWTNDSQDLNCNHSDTDYYQHDDEEEKYWSNENQERHCNEISYYEPDDNQDPDNTDEIYYQPQEYWNNDRSEDHGGRQRSLSEGDQYEYSSYNQTLPTRMHIQFHDDAYSRCNIEQNEDNFYGESPDIYDN